VLRRLSHYRSASFALKILSLWLYTCSQTLAEGMGQSSSRPMASLVTTSAEVHSELVDISESQRVASTADNDDPMIYEVKTTKEVVREKVNKAEAQDRIIRVDSDECIRLDGASDMKEEKDARRYFDTVTDEAQKRMIAPKRLEAPEANNSVIEIEDKDDGQNDAVAQNEDRNVELTEEEKECISERLTQLYAAEVDASLDCSYLCTECNMKPRKNDCCLICSECSMRFHSLCLKERYHIVWDDLNNERFVCPRCKGVKAERYDSDGDSSFSYEGY